MAKKKLKDSKIVKWVKEKAPNMLGDVLDIAGEFTGVEALERIGEKIKGNDKLSAENKVESLDLLREDIKVFTLEVQDVQNARQREIEVARLGKKDWMQPLVGIIGLGAFVFIIVFLAFKTVPEANRELFLHTVGIIEGVAIGIVGYYYGSKRKNNQ